MASLSTDSSGGRRIQFIGKNGNRKSIRLGAVPIKMAQGVLVRVEQLVASSLTGHPVDDATSRWVSGLDDTLAEKLATVGLIPRRPSMLLAPFVDGYIESRTDAKPNTVKNYKVARKSLVDYFGADKPLRSIKSGEGDEWRQGMVQAGLAEATISKRVKHARQFFKLAQRKGLIDQNPFQDVKAGSQRNEARLMFIDRETIEKVIAAAPTPEWRLIIALARYGGLRTPSETLTLKWSDVDWENGRLTVPSPKTEHQNKPYRVIPLFPELRPYLEAAFHEAAEGSVFVVTTVRSASTTRRTAADANVEDSAAGRSEAVAAAVPQFAGQPANGTGRPVPAACRNGLDRQLARHCRPALSKDDGRPFPEGCPGAGRPRCGGKSGAKSGAESSRNRWK